MVSEKTLIKAQITLALALIRKHEKIAVDKKAEVDRAKDARECAMGKARAYRYRLKLLNQQLSNLENQV